MLEKVKYGVTSVTLFLLLLSTLTQLSETQRILPVSILKDGHPQSTGNGEKLALIREWSKAGGAPQIDSGLHHQEDICLEEGCLDAALELLSAINMTVDPCKDFFQYSCGRWLANNPIPESMAQWGRLDVMDKRVNVEIQAILEEEQSDEDIIPFNQAKDFYKMCMDIGKIEDDGLEPVLHIIADFNGWQLLNPEGWNETGFDWLWAVAELKRVNLQSALFSTHVSADLKNTTRSVVYIDQPNFGLPRGILIAAENFTDIIASYRTYIVEVAQELGSVQDEASLIASANAVISVEVEMAKISSSDEARYDMDRIYNPFTLSEFQNFTDEMDDEFRINWKKYLDGVFSSASVSISDSEEIVVNEVDYIKNLIPILKNTDPATLANYVIWRLVSALVPHTTTAMRNITFRFQQALSGKDTPEDRNVTCANVANNVFGVAIGVKYIEAAFDKDSKTEVEMLVENLRVVFKEMVSELDWMEEVTRSEAIAKADAIRSFMAYPDWLENGTAVEEFYDGLRLESRYVESQITTSTFHFTKRLETLRKPTNRDEWTLDPGIVNARYSPELNVIMFPAGILQTPLFGKSRPKSQNYGAIGVVIGHEISHGFDNRGAQFDKDGNAENWWDEVTKEEYDRRAQCMSDQYSGFFADAANLYVNGDLTLGENIADNGGLRQAFRAYQKYVEENGPEGRLPGLEHLSTDQLFFLGYANIWCESITPEGLVNQVLTDHHSPSEFRVKGPIRNNYNFARAFNCPVDSDGMNPPEEEKCTVW